jgi:predicted O-methyltransferase YrrM
MSKILEELFLTNSFKRESGDIVTFNSHTPLEQCLFIQQIIKDHGLKKSIEIGFAHGLSALAICEGVKNNGGTKHIVIDKFESTHWSNIGLELVSKFGFGQIIDYREKYCFETLAELINGNEKFDFAYIDSVKQFDWILTDFFLLDKLLMENGCIIFDDVSWPGIRRVVRFVSKLPSYKILGSVPQNRINRKRQFISSLVRIIPDKEKLFRDDVLVTDSDLGINSRCVAFKKIKNDDRNWDWNTNF